MDRRDEGQMELFSSQGGMEQSRLTRKDSTFIARVRVYERTILMLISIFITAIVAFTAGMEKGKHNAAVLRQAQPAQSAAAVSSQAVQSAAVSIPATPPPVPLVGPAPVPALQTVTDAPVVVRKEAQGGQRYTIQLASFKSRSFAEKDGERLKKQGYSVIITEKGSYSVLCVGNFSSREKAKAMLGEMKKRYNGCFVKKM